MELISHYLKNSKKQQLIRVFDLWKEGGVLSTPEMAEIIEQAGITRHDFDAKFLSVRFSPPTEVDDETLATSIMAFIIYCIDGMKFEELDKALEYIPFS